jgi:hypothetical protein
MMEEAIWPVLPQRRRLRRNKLPFNASMDKPPAVMLPRAIILENKRHEGSYPIEI